MTNVLITSLIIISIIFIFSFISYHNHLYDYNTFSSDRTEIKLKRINVYKTWSFVSGALLVIIILSLAAIL